MRPTTILEFLNAAGLAPAADALSRVGPEDEALAEERLRRLVGLWVQRLALRHELRKKAKAF